MHIQLCRGMNMLMYVIYGDMYMCNDGCVNGIMNKQWQNCCRDSVLVWL